MGTGQLMNGERGDLMWVPVGVPEGPGRELLPGPVWRSFSQQPRRWHVPQETAATCAPNWSALLAGLEPELPTITRVATPGHGFPIAPSP